MACNHWSEEKVIDYILGHLSDESNNIVKKQIEDCNHCHSQYVFWQSTLPKDQESQPSSYLKKRTLNTFNKMMKKTNMLGWKTKVSSVAVIGLAIMSFILFNHSPKQQIETLNNEYMLIMKDATEVYEFEPQVDLNTKGYALVNDQSNEIYLTFDGLSPIANKDFQAWVKTHNGLVNAGVLQLLDGRGQLYQRSGPFGRVEYIIISLEPKGGSRSPSNQHSHLINVKLKKTNLENF